MSANVTASASARREEILQPSRSACQWGSRTLHLGSGDSHEDPPSVCDWPHAKGRCPWLGASVRVCCVHLFMGKVLFSLKTGIN